MSYVTDGDHSLWNSHLLFLLGPQPLFSAPEVAGVFWKSRLSIQSSSRHPFLELP